MRKTISIGILGLVVGLLVAESASATTIMSGTLRFTSPSAADFDIVMDLRGQDAADFRGAIDGSGDMDGTVTAEEVEAFETEFKDEISEGAEEGFGEDLTIDGRASSKGTVNRFGIEGAEGDVSSTSSLKITLLNLLEFPVTAGESHTMTFKASESSGDEETTEGSFDVVTPPGYYVSAPESWPTGVVISGDHRTLTFNANEDIQTDLVVTLTKGQFGAKGGAPGMAWLLAALGLLVALARRPA